MSNRYKITIIEDDTAIRELYAIKLRSKGFEVTTAADGASGLHLVEHVRPDLLLLDIRLPHLQGNEVLKRIRATEWGSLIKVIVLTNVSKSEASQDFRFLNIDRYVVKVHHTPSRVVQIINEVLNIK